MPIDPNSNYPDPDLKPKTDPEFIPDPETVTAEERTASGWAIAGIVVVIILGIGLFQNYQRTANVTSIEPAAGSVTNTDSTTVTNTTTDTNTIDTNTTTPTNTTP